MELNAKIAEDEDDWEVELPPDFALIGTLGMEPKLVNDALSRPYAKEWQTALDYEIRQLQKLSTWVIEDLPKGHTAIPCSVVLKEKHGPNGEITSYWVCIVAGGHQQDILICSQNTHHVCHTGKCHNPRLGDQPC